MDVFGNNIQLIAKKPRMNFPNADARSKNAKATFRVHFWMVESTSDPKEINAELGSVTMPIKIGKTIVNIDVATIVNNAKVSAGSTIKILKSELKVFLQKGIDNAPEPVHEAKRAKTTSDGNAAMCKGKGGRGKASRRGRGKGSK